ncbi:hypothetical protein VTN00DRAFT_4151 [Thermoascus crustaceus]|uniref:uncharacterized protein n=1 Tax=Thermoascus crustaceus TaxID=5088 RepID=UPI0037420249
MRARVDARIRELSPEQNGRHKREVKDRVENVDEEGETTARPKAAVVASPRDGAGEAREPEYFSDLDVVGERETWDTVCLLLRSGGAERRNKRWLEGREV